MPLTKIACCKSDTPCSVEECLDHAATRRNTCPYTFEILSAMYAGAVAHPSHDDGERISTTTLTSKCLRSETLKRQLPYVVAPDDLWASFRGTNLHGQLENFAHPRAYAEVRFLIDDITSKIPDLVLANGQRADFSGSPDLVDPGAGILYDYKRCKDVPRYNNVWPDHVQQLNINRWLVDHADYVVERSGEVHDMTDRAVRAEYVPLEWQELVIIYIDDKGPKPSTVTKSIQIPAKKGGTKAARVPDVWDDATVEALICERYVAARNAFDNGTAPIPDGWENQSHLLCGFCPVRSVCARRERKGE